MKKLRKPHWSSGYDIRPSSGIPGFKSQMGYSFLIERINDLDNATKNKTLLDSIFYWYYSKDLKDKKGDNKGIRLIKKFAFKIYKLMKEILKETSSEDQLDA